MNKKGQIKEIGSLIVIGIVLYFAFKIVGPFLNLISTGASPEVIVEALIPLFIFAMFFEFIRRFFV